MLAERSGWKRSGSTGLPHVASTLRYGIMFWGNASGIDFVLRAQ